MQWRTRFHRFHPAPSPTLRRWTAVLCLATALVPSGGAGLLLGGGAGFLLGGCAKKSASDLCRPVHLKDTAAYVAHIEDLRHKREEAYRREEGSPIPAEELPHWKGLEFYPVDPRYLLEGPLVRWLEPRPTSIPDTGGEDRPAEEIGYFLLDLGAGEEKLPVYHMLKDDELFLPFLDATTEVETYPAGRYLDLVPLGHDRYRLDFNMAYNPYCAYGDAWSCPITPERNRLKAAVRAGEKGYRYQH